MAQIVYTRSKHQPEVIYLPLEHGGFVQLQDGAHQYPEHAGYGLKNSTNTVVQQYLKTGQITVVLDNNNSVSLSQEPHTRQFAPLDPNDNFGIGNKKIIYSPIASLPQQDNVPVTVSETSVDEAAKDISPRTRKSAV
jgi:hypothetical protein